MGITPADARFRDELASKAIGQIMGHTASALVVPQSRRLHDGWLYWGLDSLIFIADQPIFDGQRALSARYEELRMPTTKYLLYNGELKFDSVTPPLIFHSTRGRIKQVEKAIRQHLNNLL